MKLVVASDLHLEVAGLESFAAAGEFIVLAGDVHDKPAGVAAFVQRLPRTPIVYVLGNHEFDNAQFDAVLAAYRAALAEFENVHLLENERVTIGGVQIFGATLWSDTAPQARSIDRLTAHFGMQGAGAAALAERHAATVDWLRACGDDVRGGVVVTHMAPSERSHDPRFAGSKIAAFFATDLEPLIAELAPALWIHGHIHRPVDYRVGATRVFANPRGYPGERDRWSPVVVDL
ncbi:MAG: metallophosphoesterase [Vulcanimicrobiaceae bacterium]